MDRDFKGIWIPKEVWLDDRLSALEKIILAEIDSLDDGETGCFAGNQYLAEFCQCSVTKVSTCISKLVELGYLESASFDGRKRVLKSSLSKFERQNNKNCKADFQKVKGSLNSNIASNIVENRYCSFDDFWKLYPKKVGKAQAEKAWNKLKVDEPLFEAMKKAIECQKRSKQWKDKQYIPYPATWLNGRRWEDELEDQNELNHDADAIREFF